MIVIDTEFGPMQELMIAAELAQAIQDLPSELKMYATVKVYDDAGVHAIEANEPIWTKEVPS